MENEKLEQIREYAKKMRELGEHATKAAEEIERTARLLEGCLEAALRLKSQKGETSGKS